MAETALDGLGRPLPGWMQEHLAAALAGPRYTAAQMEAARALQPPPLALMLCAGCVTQWAVEGDVGDEQGGTAWFCHRCTVPDRYLDVFIRRAVPAAAASGHPETVRVTGGVL